MLKFIINRNVRRCLNQTALRPYSKGCDVECPKPKGCKMENTKSNIQESNCLPKEPKCLNSPRDLTKSMPKGQDNSQASCCDNERLTRDPCYQRRVLLEKKDLKLNRQVLPLKSVWEYPAECCGNPCPELLPRFDSLYYSTSDKEKRQYQQTWVECPEIKIRKRKVCCYDPSELPPICKRPKAECPQTACAMDNAKLKALCCLNQTKACARVKMPCCRVSRMPPSCKNPRGPTDCQKKCCPYPAFSECCRPCPKPRRPVECQCLKTRTKCEMFMQLRRKLAYDLPPPVPSWPPKMIGPRN